MSTPSVVLAVFALILVGYLARKTGVLGVGASREISRFVVYLALPTLLFGSMARASWGEIFQPGLVAAFGSGCFVVFVLTVWLRNRAGRPLVDAAIDGLNAAYANTAFLGIPLAVLVFGDLGLLVATVATILTVIILLAIAVALIEVSLHREHSLPTFVGKVLLALLRNPLVIAPALGALYAASGLALNPGINSFIDLLGTAASPCALVALGLFLADSKPAGSVKSAMPLVVLKLFVQPAITAVLAFQVFELDLLTAQACVLLSMLPTGTGPFMLAEYYQRDADVTSRTILLTTLGSLVTVSGYLAMINR